MYVLIFLGVLSTVLVLVLRYFGLLHSWLFTTSDADANVGANDGSSSSSWDAYLNRNVETNEKQEREWMISRKHKESSDLPPVQPPSSLSSSHEGRDSYLSHS
jgi:hypothetical protein